MRLIPNSLSQEAPSKGKPFLATHHFLTTPEKLLQLVRVRWSIEDWQRIRDTQLNEDTHRYRGKGAGSMAMLLTAALNLLRLAEFKSNQAGLQVLIYNITALLAMVQRQPLT